MVVRDLLQWRAPAVLILAVLLVQWNTDLKHTVDICLKWQAFW